MAGKGKPRLISVVLLLITVFNSHAQELTGIITGRVLDKDTRQPIPQTHIILESVDTQKIEISDSSGAFKSENIPLGRYDVRVQHLGFYHYQIKDQLVEAGNVVFLEILLSSSPLVLESLEISAGPDNYPISSLSQNTISLEQSQRYAATFYDPARLATTFPGVASANDQANHISIRGHSPNFITWRIDGLDFVNPNHLTNAGTMSDRPSINGGGVSVLSAQMMSDSKLLRGAFPVSYGNALSGIFDIKLRKAEKENWSYTLQGGVLGVEAAIEGPLDKEKKGGFMTNYRYSTIGLLSAAGLDVGDEKINFQDLAFKLDADSKKAGSFSVFGIGGLSNESFESERHPDKWETLEDRIDTEFQSNMGGIGLTHQLLIGQNSRINNKLSFSHISSQREGNLITDSLESLAIEYDQYAQSLISFCSQFNTRINQANSLYAGFQYNQIRYNLVSSLFDSIGTIHYNARGQGTLNLYQPFVRWQVKFENSWQISGGSTGYLPRLTTVS